MPRYDDLAVGDQLPAQTFPVHRADLIRYAGASGDFNEIHWNERIAVQVGLPNVIAHGMLTMAQAIRIVTDWIGDPSAVVEYGVRFIKPVVVPDDEAGASVQYSGKIAALLGENKVRVDLTAISDGQKVLGRAQAIVRVP
jgi:acyl dehydratase